MYISPVYVCIDNQYIYPLTIQCYTSHSHKGAYRNVSLEVPQADKNSSILSTLYVHNYMKVNHGSQNHQLVIFYGTWKSYATLRMDV